MAKAQRVEHAVRTKDGGTILIKNLTRTTAIKLQCGECMGWDTLPADCTDAKCPLFPFRGRTLRANRAEVAKSAKAPMTAEHKAKMRAGLQKRSGGTA